MNKKPGMKFTEKYGVSTANLYKGNPESVRIPGPDHPLYDPSSPTTFDELMVQALDRDGEMTDAIEVLTDADAGLLWIVDGRNRWLNVQEANRQRALEGRAPIEPYIVPYRGDERSAILRIYEKNFHRRLPTPSAQAFAIHRLRKAGYGWDAIAAGLHHVTNDAEQWARKLLPIAYCVEEVRTAFDAGEFPRSYATRFGGSAADGSKALGKREQVALLAELRHDKEKESSKPATVGAAHRNRLRAALTNGASEKLGAADRKLAEIVAATLARIDGDKKALRDWPEIDAIFEETKKKAR